MQDNRIAIVTGAARGIGKAIAFKLASEGKRVALVDIDQAALQATTLEMGSGHFGITVDVGNAAEMEAAINQIVSELGSPSILVNNAGFARDHALEAMTLDDWDSVHDVHLRAAFIACRAVTPHMVAQQWGRIVNISSISARGHSGRVNYCAAKAGLEGLTRALSIELGSGGITVNAIAPGLIVTRMTQATATRLGRTLPEHVQQAAASIPVRRVGHPEDIAAPVSFFCSEEAGFINGQILYVAGGPC